jgi:DNA-directed RNA polymerase alpha subunit
MEQKISNQRIDRLDINDNILNVLKENEITTLGNLCSKSKQDLKKLDFTENEINKIDIEVQLLGLNLRFS